MPQRRRETFGFARLACLRFGEAGRGGDGLRRALRRGERCAVLQRRIRTGWLSVRVCLGRVGGGRGGGGVGTSLWSPRPGRLDGAAERATPRVAAGPPVICAICSTRHAPTRALTAMHMHKPPHSRPRTRTRSRTCEAARCSAMQRMLRA
jgi:hypothetical protein